jgi:hypothetical protein
MCLCVGTWSDDGASPFFNMTCRPCLFRANAHTRTCRTPTTHPSSRPFILHIRRSADIREPAARQLQKHMPVSLGNVLRRHASAAHRSGFHVIQPRPSSQSRGHPPTSVPTPSVCHSGCTPEFPRIPHVPLPLSKANPRLPAGEGCNVFPVRRVENEVMRVLVD